MGRGGTIAELGNSAVTRRSGAASCVAVIAGCSICQPQHEEECGAEVVLQPEAYSKHVLGCCPVSRNLLLFSLLDQDGGCRNAEADVDDRAAACRKRGERRGCQRPMNPQS